MEETFEETENDAKKRIKNNLDEINLTDEEEVKICNIQIKMLWNIDTHLTGIFILNTFLIYINSKS